MHNPLSKIDPEVYKLIKSEEKRQYIKLRLIPSENYVSQAVLEPSLHFSLSLIHTAVLILLQLQTVCIREQ